MFNTPGITSVFPWTQVQRARLELWRAWWEEGDARYRNWRLREEDEETTEAFGQILREADFAAGNDLTPEQLDRLCALARRLAPNANLDRRLYPAPEARAIFNRLLRNLLYGADPLPKRLAAFLARKGVGAQTATQLLCAAFPARYPLVRPQELSALELSLEQYEAAWQQARRSLEIGAPSGAAMSVHPEALSHPAEAGALKHDFSTPKQRLKAAGLTPVERLLRDFVIYAAVRERLGASTYLEVHRILSLAPREAAPLPVPVSAVEAREGRADYRAAPPVETQLLEHLEAYVAEQGFTYPPFALRNYYIALKTKPFVILCGISGTGKTRLTQLFAEALTGGAEGQYLLVPVRPDWTDPTVLLGYHNILAGPEGRYVSTRFLDLLQTAGRPENAGRAYFVCLDEMNLARVEHYFADVLSAMETPSHEIHLHGEKVVRIPPNFFITGSVNVDESTHVFSRKVLDRANTIEFSEVDLKALIVAPETSKRRGRRNPPDATLGAKERQSLFLSSRVADPAAAQRRLRALDPALVGRTLEILTALNEALSLAQMPFGYRIRDEVLMYLANSFDARGRGLFVPNVRRNFEVALDFQIMQKVLPRLSGTQEQIESAVRALLRLLLPSSEPMLHNVADNLRSLEKRAEEATFPRSSRKLARLLARLQRDGYASFYEG